MRNPFRNYRAEFLERQIDLIIANNRENRAAVEALNLQIQYDSMRELTDLKKSHAKELEYVKNELSKMQDEYQRLQRTIHPAMQSVELPNERTAPSPPNKKPLAGSPWMRVQAAWQVQQEEEFAKKHLQPVDTPAETSTSQEN